MNTELLKNLSSMTETCFINDKKRPFDEVKALSELVVSDEDIDDAHARLLRFAPFIRKAFPETEETDGIIESPLVTIDSMKRALETEYGCNISGKLFLKLDSHLKISGSVKARGGIYEVLKHAETLAVAAGKISVGESYEKFASPEMREFLSQYTVQVGSTGNLGMSIGIMSAALGFRVIIHMSSDAKTWKKELLRSRGVTVMEYDSDYTQAVANGRKSSDTDPASYFVDDEKSVDLFVGYAVAAKRLKAQLDEKGLSVSKNSPLIVYFPAGVGGAPGGVGYGLKRIFGDNVHLFFVEPVLFPSVLYGIASGKHEKADVKELGIFGRTSAADGLACPSPSGFVTRMMTNHLSGEFTVKDGTLYDYLRMLYRTEKIKIEPSACAGFEGARKLLEYEETKKYCNQNGLSQKALENSIQIIWTTGGSMVPEANFEECLNTYE